MLHNLSLEQIKAIELLGKGYSVFEVSKEIGVCKSTIYRWLNKDSRFKQAKNEFENTLHNELWCVVANEMYEILLDGTVNQKIPIIQLVAKMNNKVFDKVEVDVKKEVFIDDELKRLGIDLNNFDEQDYYDLV